MNKQHTSQLQLPCGAVTASFWEPKSALGHILRLFLAFVPNLFVAWAKWANVLVGLSAFMGTALGDINSHCSCKAARFDQLEASQDRNKCKVWRASVHTISTRKQTVLCWFTLPQRNKTDNTTIQVTLGVSGIYCLIRHLNSWLYWHN